MRLRSWPPAAASVTAGVNTPTAGSGETAASRRAASVVRMHGRADHRRSSPCARAVARLVTADLGAVGLVVRCPALGLSHSRIFISSTTAASAAAVPLPMPNLAGSGMRHGRA